jgi:hypothetical protein
MIGLSMDIEVKLPPDFEEHIASIKWSMRPFANRNLFKIDHLLISPTLKQGAAAASP